MRTSIVYRALIAWLILIAWLAVGAVAQSGKTEALPKAPTDVAPGSITYEDIAYPYPVSYLPLTLYGQDLQMAYMDIPPAGTPNGRVIVMFHGMNFGGFYFGGPRGPIEALRKEGFRLIVPDQIGFGRSSKAIIPYNFHDMAANSRKLLAKLNIDRAVIFGHSMGGMLAARFSSSYPDVVERTVICNPIGTSDVRWQVKWPSADDAYKASIAMNHDQLYQGAYQTIRRYFPDAWKPEYENYARIMYAPMLSADWPRLAMVRAMAFAIRCENLQMPSGASSPAEAI